MKPMQKFNRKHRAAKEQTVTHQFSLFKVHPFARHKVKKESACRLLLSGKDVTRRCRRVPLPPWNARMQRERNNLRGEPSFLLSMSSKQVSITPSGAFIFFFSKTKTISYKARVWELCEILSMEKSVTHASLPLLTVHPELRHWRYFPSCVSTLLWVWASGPQDSPSGELEWSNVHAKN
jgi:hypothetical protein